MGLINGKVAATFIFVSWKLMTTGTHVTQNHTHFAGAWTVLSALASNRYVHF